MDGENGRGFEEYEWAGQKRIRATALLEGGFRGTHTQTLFFKHMLVLLILLVTLEESICVDINFREAMHFP